MKKLLAILFCLSCSVALFSQDEKKGSQLKVYKDAGTVTATGYTNSTYKIRFTLPSAKWMVIKDKMSLVSTNGKVAEYWILDKDIRVAVTIEETTRRLIDLAEAKIYDMTYSFRRLQVIKDKEFFPRRGDYLVYYQEMQGEKATGARFKIKNYILMSKNNRGVKISLFIIAPLDTYYQNRFFLGEIWKNFIVE